MMTNAILRTCARGGGRIPSVVLGVLAMGCLPLAMSGCGGGNGGGGSGSAGGGDGRTYVVCTTTMVADLARELGGDVVRVKGLMAPTVDPHLYEPTPNDGIELRRADLIFFNGLHLEGKMTEVLEGKEKARAVSDFVDAKRLIVPEGAGDESDPHVWGDVKLWIEAAKGMAGELAGADAANKAHYEERLATYVKTLEELDAWVRSRFGELPESDRLLVTSHDAFNYFGRAYGLEVVGLQGISTVSEPSLADRVKLVEMIKERGVRAIFPESSVQKAAIESVSRDSGAKVGDELFSDALGEAGKMETVGGETYDVGTYVGMIKHNVNAIVEAMKP